MNSVCAVCFGFNSGNVFKDCNDRIRNVDYKYSRPICDAVILEKNAECLLPVKQNCYEELQTTTENDVSILLDTFKSIFSNDAKDVVAKADKKDCSRAVISYSQSVINLPNAIDDAVDAIDQFDKYVKSKYYGENFKYAYKKAYNFKNAQHPFSYFRGTLLKNLVNPNSSYCISKPIACWLVQHDVTLWDTKLKKGVVKAFNIKEDLVKTTIKHISSTDAKKVNIKAYKFVSKSTFGKLVARSMTRVPVIGLVIAGGIEGCQVINEVKQGADVGKSVWQGVTRLVVSTVLTAVLGAIGATIAGPIGSIIGICLGGFLGDKVAQVII